VPAKRNSKTDTSAVDSKTSGVKIEIGAVQNDIKDKVEKSISAMKDDISEVETKTVRSHCCTTSQ
jgi:hypothetical protein